MKKNNLIKLFAATVITTFCCQHSFAQLTITGQLRTRTEFRDGQGTLPVAGQKPTVFTSQRTRLNIGYSTDHLKLYTSFQDIRDWGQEESTISNLDGNKLMLYEGWAEIIFNDTTHFKKIKNLSLKIGKQEIAYDDERVLGSLNWLQQGRTHDAAILKFAHKTWITDAGFAFNQNYEKKNAGTLYYGTPVAQLAPDGTTVSSAAGTNGIGTMYKAMQYLYASKELGFSKASFLFFTDDFQKTTTTGTGAAAVTSPVNGVNTRVTVGGNIFGVVQRKHNINATFYFQGNENKNGQLLRSWMGSLNTWFQTGRKLSIGPGVDYISGNSLTYKSTSTGEVASVNSTIDRRFDPLYGTPHKFRGYMDYFYAADAYGLNGNNLYQPGLLDTYLKFKYKLRDNLTATLDVYEFWTGSKISNGVGGYYKSRLGTEIDFLLIYNMTKQISIEGGYSMMFGTNTLDILKAPALPADKRTIGNWAYVMITIKPDFMAGINSTLKTLSSQVDQLSKK